MTDPSIHRRTFLARTGLSLGGAALSSLLVRWAAKLKAEADVPLLIAHFERLAVTSAIVSGVRRASESLKGHR